MRMRLGRYRPEGGSMHIRTKARGWLAGVAAFTLLVSRHRAGGRRPDRRAAQPVRGQRPGHDRPARPRRLRPQRGQGHRQDRQARHRGDAGPGPGAARQGRDGRGADARARDVRAFLAADRSGARLRRLPALEPDAGSLPRHLHDAERPAQEVVPRPRVALPRAGQGGDDRTVDPRPADQGLQAHRRCALHARRLASGHALRVHPARTRVDLRRGQPAPLRLVHRPPWPTATSSGCCSRTRSGSSR